MTRTERLLRLARMRGDRAAELILTPHEPHGCPCEHCGRLTRTGPIRVSGQRLWHAEMQWTEAELREAWGR